MKNIICINEVKKLFQETTKNGKKHGLRHRKNVGMKVEEHGIVNNCSIECDNTDKIMSQKTSGRTKGRLVH